MNAEQMLIIDAVPVIIFTAVGVIVAESLLWRTSRRTLTATGYRLMWTMVLAVVNDVRPSTRRDLTAEADAAREEAELADIAARNARIRRQIDIASAMADLERADITVTAHLLAATTSHPLDECAEQLASREALIAEMRRWRT